MVFQLFVVLSNITFSDRVHGLEFDKYVINEKLVLLVSCFQWDVKSCI